MKYIYKNVNPKNKKVDDCAIRAVTMATGQDYKKVFFDLCKAADAVCDMPNSIDVFGPYLVNKGFTKVTYKVQKGQKRDTVESLINKYPKNVLVIRVAGHITVGYHGNLVDIWDCSDSSVYTYWIK